MVRTLTRRDLFSAATALATSPLVSCAALPVPGFYSFDTSALSPFSFGALHFHAQGMKSMAASLVAADPSNER